MVEINSRSLEDRILAAESLASEGKIEEAETTIRDAIKSEKDLQRRSRLYGALGRIWSAQNRTREAKEAFRHAVFLFPMSAPSHWQLGKFLLKNGELEDAEAAFRMAIRFEPNVSHYHSSLGAVLLEQRFYQDADLCLRRAIRLDWRNTTARELQARLQMAQGNYPRAIKTLKRARFLDRKALSILWFLSTIYEEQGRFSEAISCTKRILYLDPSNKRSLLKIVEQSRKANRLQHAERVLRHVLDREKTATGYYSLTQILLAQSRNAQAIAAIGKARELDPTNQTYQTQLTKISGAIRSDSLENSDLTLDSQNPRRLVAAANAFDRGIRKLIYWMHRGDQLIRRLANKKT